MIDSGVLEKDISTASVGYILSSVSQGPKRNAALVFLVSVLLVRVEMFEFLTNLRIETAVENAFWHSSGAKELLQQGLIERQSDDCCTITELGEAHLRQILAQAENE